MLAIRLILTILLIVIIITIGLALADIAHHPFIAGFISCYLIVNMIDFLLSD